MRWRDTVSFKDLHPAMLLASFRIESIISNTYGKELWITSGNDSVHLPDSKHYKGLALDYHTHDLKHDDKRTFELQVGVALGPQFYVLLEDLDTPNEHLHVQFNGQPQPTFTTGTITNVPSTTTQIKD